MRLALASGFGRANRFVDGVVGVHVEAKSLELRVEGLYQLATNVYVRILAALEVGELLAAVEGERRLRLEVALGEAAPEAFGL